MVDLGEEPRFVQSTAGVERRRRPSRTNDLQRNFEVQAGIDRAIHGPERPLPDLACDGERAPRIGDRVAQPRQALEHAQLLESRGFGSDPGGSVFQSTRSPCAMVDATESSFGSSAWGLSVMCHLLSQPHQGAAHSHVRGGRSGLAERLGDLCM